jgi:hypothetical protein
VTEQSCDPMRNPKQVSLHFVDRPPCLFFRNVLAIIAGMLVTLATVLQGAVAQEPEEPPATGDLLTTMRRLVVERSCVGQSGSRSLLLRHAWRDDATAAPHVKLAGSRALLEVGEQRAAIRDWDGAFACAQAGLQELGTGYASPAVVDDTTLKLSGAEGRLRSGHTEDAATTMLRILTTRTQLYVEHHADEIEE